MFKALAIFLLLPLIIGIVASTMFGLSMGIVMNQREFVLIVAAIFGVIAIKFRAPLPGFIAAILTIAAFAE